MCIRDRGMAATYRGQIEAIVAAEGWTSTTLSFPNEIVFVVTK